MKKRYVGSVIRCPRRDLHSAFTAVMLIVNFRYKIPYLSSLTALKLRRTSPREVFVQSNTSVFLPCPVHSFHATYRWEKDNCIKNYPCIFSGDFCVLGPVVDTPLKEGVFRCMATEDGFKVEVISFRLVNDGRLLAASLAFTLGPSLLLAMATLWLH